MFFILPPVLIQHPLEITALGKVLKAKGTTYHANHSL